MGLGMLTARDAVGPNTNRRRAALAAMAATPTQTTARQPERALWLAVLDQAEREARERPTDAESDARRTSLLAWCEDDETTGIGTLEWVSQVCGIAPDMVRRQLIGHIRNPRPTRRTAPAPPSEAEEHAEE